MYFYNLSSGLYSDYQYNLIMHEKKFTRQEFIDMYNKAIRSKEDGEFIVNVMCEKYGFQEVVEELEINSEYEEFKEITDEKDINGTNSYISLYKHN